MPSSIYPIGSQTGNVSFSGNAMFSNNSNVIYLSSSLIPLQSSFNLGSLNYPYQDLFVSGGSISVASTVAGTSGVLITNLSGNLVFTNGGLIISNVNTLSTQFSIQSSGKTYLNVPFVSAGTYGALAIVGTANGITQPITNNGTMLHITANDNNNATFLMDAFGTGVFPQHVSRVARGTSIAPAPISAGDIIVKIVANGYNSLSGFILPNGSKFGATTIEAVATENWSNTIGTQWNFYNASSADPTASKKLNASINSTGIVLPVSGAGVTFGDGTFQNTAFNTQSGTWTPILTAATNGTGIKYTNATIGNYFKNGKIVYCTFSIVLSSTDAASGQVYLTGLPYPTVNGTGVWGTLNVYRYSNMGTTVSQVQGGNEGNAQNFTLYYQDTGAGAGNVNSLTVTQLTNTTTMYGSLQYATFS